MFGASRDGRPRIYGAVIAAGREPRGRQVDLLIAATALDARLPLYTCKPDVDPPGQPLLRLPGRDRTTTSGRRGPAAR